MSLAWKNDRNQGVDIYVSHQSKPRFALVKTSVFQDIIGNSYTSQIYWEY
jgi:hypothetical protein